MKKGFVLVLLSLIIGLMFVAKQNNNKLTYQTTEIKIGTKTIIAKIADTQEKRELGLSGQKDLAPRQGMLFVFEQQDFHGFWMKDMKFPVDIIWLDNNKQVIGLTKNLQPKSYPKIFYPPQKIKMALEIKSGQNP